MSDVQNLGFMPARIIGGETIWIAAGNTTQDAEDIVIADYTPAGGYTLAYRFSAPTVLDVNALANITNTGWTLTVTAAQTLLWKSGEVRFIGLVTHTATGRVFAVDSGAIIVTESPFYASQYQAALTAIEAAIANYATSPQRSFSLGDMSVTYGSLQELLDLRAFYQTEVARERGSVRRIIRARFA
jgi:hypothetical protein